MSRPSRIANLFIRRVAIAPVFAVGLLVGAAVTLGATGWQGASRVAAAEEVVPRPDVVQVKGEDATLPGLVASDQLMPLELALPERAVRAGPAWPALSPRQVAKQALRTSVFVRGNGIYGAGIAIDKRYVLTCLHVVDAMTNIEVSLAEGPAQSAQIRDRDVELDLAVLELAQPGLEQDQHAAELASAMSLEMGDSVFAMGAPRKMTFSLARGIVSYVGRPYDQVYFLQTDIATNRGSSGGPVLDDRGRVIGLSSFILRDSQGLAFALPIDYAYKRFTKFFANTLDTKGFDSWLAQRTSRHAQPKLVVSGGSPKY